MTDFDKFCFIVMGVTIFLVYLYATMPPQEYKPQTIESIGKDISTINSNTPDPVTHHYTIDPGVGGWLVGIAFLAIIGGGVSIAVFGAMEAARSGRRFP